MQINHILKILLLFFPLCWASCSPEAREVPLEKGMIIRASTLIKPGGYLLSGSDSLDQPVITIEGESITVDFQEAVLRGNKERRQPDQFSGLGILIRNSRNITLKNFNVHGFKVALMAENVDSLRILDADLSYNYRQNLRSIREREDLSDWLSYHDNDNDEWLRYGAGIYLKNCDRALVKGVRISNGQNGLMLTQCEEGLFYNNTIHFNSGVGIGLYRSSHNRIMHNRLDWNVRGYSHGFYSRGQDSAGILCYEQSNENTFAYNSATHSGDGFFLWAGQSTMDTGEGGCNNNLIYGNDFSQAPTNGVEVTFSSNRIINNRLEECTYGIWGGYSWSSLLLGNRIINNQYGIAIEHGQDNTIRSNLFRNNETGIQLWERDRQPADWGYARQRDVSSRDYDIGRNVFLNIQTPLRISSTSSVAINDDNQFAHFQALLLEEKSNKQLVLVKNDIYQPDSLADAGRHQTMNRLHKPPTEEEGRKIMEVLNEAEWAQFAPEPLVDGLDAMLPSEHPRGRSFILLDEWGPYNFSYPTIRLSSMEADTYVFSLFGPLGNWELAGGHGFESVNPKTGSFPASLRARKAAGAELLEMKLKFIGEAFTDPFGEEVARGEPFVFSFRRFEKTLDWSLRWYEYTEESDPVNHYEAFKALKLQLPLKTERTADLAYRWWGSPGEGVPADRFATFATTSFEAVPGNYLLTVTSDDGIRLYLDGQLLIDHWDVHVPATDTATVELGGQHIIEVEHFDAGGLGTLDFQMDRTEGKNARFY